MPEAADESVPKVDRRRVAVAWAAGMVAIVPAAWFLANASVRWPEGITSPSPVPSLADVVWRVAVLGVAWTAVIAAVTVGRSWRTEDEAGRRRVADGKPLLMCLLLGLLAIGGCTVVRDVLPGCGQARSELLLPVPDGLVVLSERSGEGSISGPEVYREIVVAGGGDQEAAFQRLVAEYESRGWQLKGGTEDLSAWFPHDEEWFLSIHPGASGWTGEGPRDIGSAREDGTLVVEVEHQPRGDRGCWEFD